MGARNIVKVCVMSASAGAGLALVYWLKYVQKKQKKEAELIDGKAVAAQVRSEVAEESSQFESRYGLRPGLAVVLVGERRDSQSYVRTKKKAAKEAGFYGVDITLDAAVSEARLLEEVRKLNTDSRVHAILVQLPLPQHIDEARVLREIAVEKDADGFSAVNVGNMWMRGGEKPRALPCTAAGCVELLVRSNVQLKGKRCVVIGRSNIVGMPAAALLMDKNATVTVAHSKTQNLPQLVRQADVVVAAIGKPNYVKADWLKPGCVVIDVGINAVDDTSTKKGYRLVGDVDFDQAKKVASRITPVPGGVGPMTVAMLMRNCLELAKLSMESPPMRSTIDEEILTGTPTRLEKPMLMSINSAGETICVYRRDKLVPLDPVPSDIEISQTCKPLDITEVARSAGLRSRELILYGKDKAKINFVDVHTRLDQEQEFSRSGGEAEEKGHLVVVCGINPTPLGEGKSTTLVGLSQSLGATLGKRVITTIRQPSQGPIFGVKGGAAGGGYSQVVPMDSFNLHLTGDIHAMVAANNLVAAAVDARCFHEKTQKDQALFKRLCPANKNGKRPLSLPQRERLVRLGLAETKESIMDAGELSEDSMRALCRLDIDPDTITWKRVIDTCDRHLRRIEIGRGPSEKGDTRETGFEIAVASEIMAVVSLATSYADLRSRLGRITVASNTRGDAVTCDDLGVTGALIVLLKDALCPTLMQTIEGTPVFVHCGPFANIAHGNSSVVADQLALRLVGRHGFVLTEAGFGADIGGEKNFDIKARMAGLPPSCVVLVATVRALKTHCISEDIDTMSDIQRLEQGCANVEHHVRSVTQKFGLRVVVAVNRFANDTTEELNLVRSKCLDAGAYDALITDHFAMGGAGAAELASSLVDACRSQSKPSFRYLYPLSESIETKIFTICSNIYLAAGVEYSETAQRKLDLLEKHPLVSKFPICIAKTQYSLSTDPKKKGAPKGHTVFVRDLVPKFGAGFIVVVAGDIMLIPGLPTRPGFYDVDFDLSTNQVVGLF